MININMTNKTSDYGHIDTIIFDIDGTLVNIKPDYIHEVVLKTLAKFDRSTTKDISAKFWNEGDRDTLIEQDFSLSPEDFWSIFEYNDQPNNRINASYTYPDINILQDLSKRFKLGIVTNAPSRISQPNLSIIGKHYFSSIINSHSSHKITPKPDPEGLYICMKELDSSPKTTVYIGNSYEDVTVANNANVLDIIIKRPEYEYPGISPTIMISSLNELEPLFRQ